ncbi:MAG TPA: hypothetical protein VKU85_04420 [bacterium]|nr:hypothetical protein [bacterium]
MRQHRLFARLIVVALTTFLLSSTALAAPSTVSAAPSPGGSEVDELPVYMQLMMYVANLLSEGREIPKALLNKIDAYYKSGK